MKSYQATMLIALLGLLPSSWAQTSSGAQSNPSAGAIIMPPSTDPGIVKRPPEKVDPKAIERPPGNVDPGIVQTPPADANPKDTTRSSGGTTPGGATRQAPGASKKDDCKGPASLCKQESPR